MLESTRVSCAMSIVKIAHIRALDTLRLGGLGCCELSQNGD